MEDLTDQEFKELVKAKYTSAIQYGGGGRELGISWLEEALIDKGLAEFKAFETPPTKNFNVYQGWILKCTESGETVLHKDRIRLIHSLVELIQERYEGLFSKWQWGWGECTKLGKAAHNEIKQLSREELPEFLTHKNSWVRCCARIRAMQLDQET